MSETKYPLLSEFFDSNPSSPPTIDLDSSQLNKPFVREIQRLLKDKGFEPGEIDGIVGENTLRALANAKEALYLQYPTLIGKYTFEKLLEYEKEDKLFLPTNGIGRVSSHFNLRRRHPVTGTIRPHRGIDIAANRGTPVYAVEQGIVSLIQTTCREGNMSCGGGFGNFVRIAHINAPFNESVYAHLSEVRVRAGESVDKGQLIGTLGNTGSSTGPHLHFETWNRGVALNPTNFFNPII